MASNLFWVAEWAAQPIRAVQVMRRIREAHDVRKTTDLRWVLYSELRGIRSLTGELRKGEHQ